MKEEKSLVNILKALPDLLRMEQTSILLAAIVRQWGIGNIPRILLGAVRGTGLMNSITALLNFKLDKLAPNLFASMWDTFGDREILVVGEKRETFREFKGRVFRLANGLQDLGLKPMDRYAIMLYNCQEHLESMFGPWFVGLLSPQINWHLRDEELVKVLQLRTPKAIVIDEEFVERINKIRDQLSIEHYIVVGRDVPEDMISYDELIAKSSPEMPNGEFLIGVNPFTGGTTALPKSVASYNLSYLISDKVEAPHGVATIKELLDFTIREFSVLGQICGLQKFKAKSQVVSGPMYHGVPIYCIILGLLYGIPIVMTGGKRFDPEEILKLIDREKPSIIGGVPTHFQRIINLPDEILDKYDVSSVKGILCDGAACPPEVKKRVNEFFMKRGGAKEPIFGEAYGAVEFLGAPCGLIPDDYIKNPKRIESVGKVGRAGDVIIVDEEWRRCPPNKEGKVLVRTIGTVILDYPGTPEKLKDALVMVDGKEWYDDGELGYIDEDGYLYLTGRTKELIICGGVNIAPNQIENVIIKNPKVYDTTVIRYPDEDLGEVPLAIVQLKEGEKMTEDELKEWCRKEGLRGFLVPKRVEFRDIPLTAHGKVRKFILEKEYWEKKGIKRRG